MSRSFFLRDVSINYGYSIDNFNEHPCKCNSKNCVGFIVEKSSWPKLKKLKEKYGL